MRKALSFVRLDFITVKPYLTLKNIFIFVAVALILTISSRASVSAIGILMGYGSLYITYPFALGEKNNIDALYMALSIKRDTVVLGRYLFSLLVDICSGLMSFVFSLVVLRVMQIEGSALESLSVVLVLFFVFSTLQAIQLPIYFKLGYAKAKFIAYLPFVGLPFVVFAFTNYLRDVIPLQRIITFFEACAENPLAAALLGTVIWLAIMAASYKASCARYRKRDF